MLKVLAPLLVLAFVTPSAAQSPAELCERLAGHPWEPSHAGKGVEYGEIAAAPAIEACRAALATAPDSLEIKFRLGRALMQEERYEEGLALVRGAATAGYASAQMAYANAYRLGMGVKPDPAVAYEWLNRAAAQDHPVALDTLAMSLVYSGRGLADIDAAIELFHRAIKAGYPPAMEGLALAYDNRGTGDADLVAAFEWFMKAAEAGSPAAASNVGRAYDFGRGVKPDLKAAFEWYFRAAKAGSPIAQTQVAVFYNSGRGGVPEDKAQAVHWLRKAAAQYEPRAMLYLGDHLLSNGATDTDEGIEWLQRAGAYGEYQAYNKLAAHYLLMSDYRRAREHAEVVLNFGDEAQKAEALAIRDQSKRLELRDEIRLKDGFPLAVPGQG